MQPFFSFTLPAWCQSSQSTQSLKHTVSCYFHHPPCSLSSASRYLRDLSLLDPLNHPHWSIFFNHQLTPVFSRSQTATHFLNKLPSTLRVPYQFDPSSSPSYSDRGPRVDPFFHCHLITFPASLPQVDLLQLWPLVVWRFSILLSAAGPSSAGFQCALLLTYLHRIMWKVQMSLSVNQSIMLNVICSKFQGSM